MKNRLRTLRISKDNTRYDVGMPRFGTNAPAEQKNGLKQCL